VGAGTEPERPALRIEVHVRPGARSAAVGGLHDGALVVRVTEPADRGRATAAALRSLAEALDVAPGAVTLVHGATSRRKLVEVSVPAAGRPAVEDRLARLRAGPSVRPAGRRPR
jgi:uncharacterized protein